MWRSWLWRRLRWPRCSWPTLLLVVAETAQYFAGLAGALELHLPLGVVTIAGLVVLPCRGLRCAPIVEVAR